MVCFFFNYPATTEIYSYVHTLSLHDSLPIYAARRTVSNEGKAKTAEAAPPRSTPPAPVADPCAGLSGARAVQCRADTRALDRRRSEEHTSELQSLMRISYAVFCLKKKKKKRYSICEINKLSN